MACTMCNRPAYCVTGRCKWWNAAWSRLSTGRRLQIPSSTVYFELILFWIWKIQTLMAAVYLIDIFVDLSSQVQSIQKLGYYSCAIRHFVECLVSTWWLAKCDIYYIYSFYALLYSFEEDFEARILSSVILCSFVIPCSISPIVFHPLIDSFSLLF